MRNVQPSVSLKPASDDIQVLLGHNGFENLRRWLVGLPCEGAKTQSASGGRDELSVELEELLDDSSRQGDEMILSMVAQVARLWHSSSYQTVDTSSDIPRVTIWDDSRVVEECDRMGTKIRLFLGHAQKPKTGRKRAISC